MPMPKKIHIQNMRYRVKQVKNLNETDEKTGERIEYYGTIVHRHGSIKVEKDMTHPHQQNTLMHEIVHGLIHQTPCRNMKHEEDMCIALAPLLVRFIQDNPDAIEYFKEKK